jgi:hypothetical protein
VNKPCNPILSALGMLEYLILALVLGLFTNGMSSTSIVVKILAVATLPAWYALILFTEVFGMTAGWLGLPSGLGIVIGIATFVTLAFLLFRQLCPARTA